MNVTGVEWRDRDPNDGRFGGRAKPRRAPEPAEPAEPEEEDVVEIHSENPEDIADGIDEVVE